MNDEQRIIFSKLMNNEFDDIMELSVLIPNINELIAELERKQKSENDMIYVIYEKIAERFDVEDLKAYKLNKYLLFGIIKNQIINGLGNKNELTNLIDSLNSVDTIDKLLNDDSIELPDIIKENLLKKRTSLRTKEVFNENGDIIGNIEFTDGEIKALRAYIGEDVGYSFYPGNDMLYSITNAMFKAGRTLGETSAGWKHADAVIAILNNPEEFMGFSENLISLLHKYGKTINEHIDVVRSEPNAQFILKEGMTKSFLSTAKGGEELTSFKRDTKDSLMVRVENGVDFVDVAELLQDDYSKPDEREVLIAPFTPFSFEILEQHEYKSDDPLMNNWSCMVGKYKISINRINEIQPLSKEQYDEYKEVESIILDENIRRQAISEWKDTLNGSNKNTYIMWREAFSKLIQYRSKIICLAIDNQISQKNNGENILNNNLLQSAIEATTEITNDTTINAQLTQMITEVNQPSKEVQQEVK